MSTAIYPPPPAAPVVQVATGGRGPEAPSRVAQTGVWIGIGAISMSFAALSSALVVRQSAGDWHHLQLPALLYLNTVVLLGSSIALEIGHRRHPLVSLNLTMALGVLFVVGQVVAWRQLIAQQHLLASGPSSAFFYVFTALHAAHVLGGLAGLTYVQRRFIASGGEAALPAYRAAAIYWHFMAVLWLYLLALLTIRG